MKRKKLILIISILLSFIALTLYLTHLPGNDKIQLKKKLISIKLKEKGFHGGYILISEKRHKWYNNILSNSSDNSFHLKGMAVDFWLMDLNKDGGWNKKDIDLMVNIINEVEKEHPELAGGTGTYLNSGTLASRMVHTDVRCNKKSWHY
jgi:hypothetical protein